MKRLIILRGCPGAGKSSIIQKYGLENYTISADSIRLLFNSTIMNLEGEFEIPQEDGTEVFKLMMNLIEERMKKESFTIVDATHSNGGLLQKYKQLIEKYGYRAYVLNLDKVSLDELLERNKKRGFKKVPEYIIKKMYNDVKSTSSTIPSYFEEINETDLDGIINYIPEDLSNYDKVHFIGDIHGCNTVLKEYMSKNYKENDYFVFTGDYCDRGIENYEVIKYLSSIAKKKNVVLLKGNHENHLINYSEDKKGMPKHFDNTIKEFEEKGLEKKELRILVRKLRSVFVLKYNEKTILVNHGGITNYTTKIPLMNDSQFVKGIGKYEDDVDEIFTRNIGDKEIYQIHGHRNLYKKPINCSEKSFNLEGQVEFGGHLRIVTIDKSGFNFIEVKNEVYKKTDEMKIVSTIPEMLEVLRENDSEVQEKKFGHISSFNFTKDVFYNQNWNNITIKTRGLFINTENNTIASRSYEKFFNEGEMSETKDEALQKLKYPLKSYVKYNGFLGILGIDDKENKLLFCSKSTISSTFSDYFKNIFKSFKFKEKELIDEMITENISLAFEVIDVENDPHMIKYSKNKLVLLDVIKRTPVFEKYDYEQLKKFAEKYGFEVKQEGPSFNSFEEFDEWRKKEKFNMDYTFNGEHIEGFVFEDKDGFMFKTKLGYYSFWKQMRTFKDNFDKYIVGFLENNRKLTNYSYLGENLKEAEDVVNFFYDLSIKNILNIKETSILDLSEMYYEYKKNKRP